MVAPVAKREAVAQLRSQFGFSEKRACRIAGADRKMVRYVAQRAPDTALRGRLRELANERRRFGCRRLFVLLRREGEPSGINRIYRLYREDGGGNENSLGDCFPDDLNSPQTQSPPQSDRDAGTDPGRSAAKRTLEKELGAPIGILQDLQGPKIRLGRIESGSRILDRHEKVCFLPSETVEGETCLPLPHPEIFDAIETGHRLFIDDGRIRLRVTNKQEGRIEAEVLEGGKVSDRKGVNLPDCILDLPVLTEKDRADLQFGLDNGVDWVALSFVQKAIDLDEIKAIIDGRAGLISKIEKPSALVEIEGIVEKSDAIMIARGDLGVEIPPEDVPARQKEIIALCRRTCRPVIVATQMLESMVTSPTPTRAEASDVATAIYDGADAVMLSAESATGDFPTEAVEVMDRIICSTERHSFYEAAMSSSREACLSDADAIADTGATLACALNAVCITAYSMSGLTGLRVAARRPKLPLVVMTRDLCVARRLALVWGARSVLESAAMDYDSMVETAKLECRNLLQPEFGDKMVVLSGVPFGQVGSTNNIRVATVR